MKCRLTIGVARLEPGIRIVLGQLGVPFEAVTRLNAIDHERFAAVIVNASPDATLRQALLRYLEAGGAVLDMGYLLPAVAPASLRQRGVESVAVTRPDPVFADCWLIDLHQSVACHRQPNSLGRLGWLGRFGGGPVAYVPFDIEKAVVGHGSSRRQFYTPYSAYPDEIVARVSRGELRRAVERALIWLHQERGIPYLHRWHLPGEAEGLFAYRIDSDYGTPNQISELHSRAVRAGIPLTWFLHAAAHEGWIQRFAEFEGDEISLHCYRHRTFDTAERNSANIAEARAVMAAAGLMPVGFAAPNGFWNRALAASMEQEGFLYSSEFSLSYDDLPFHPWLLDRWCSVLQVPIHPVSIGNLMRAGASADAMRQYYRWIIDRRAYLREPAFLYHHPGHEHWDVMEDSFLYALERRLQPTTLGAFADWWLRREGVRYEAWVDNDVITVQFAATAPDVCLAVRSLDGRLAFLRGERCELDALAWQPAPCPPVEMPADIARARRFSLRVARHSIEDFNARARQ